MKSSPGLIGAFTTGLPKPQTFYKEAFVIFAVAAWKKSVGFR